MVARTNNQQDTPPLVIRVGPATKNRVEEAARVSRISVSRWLTDIWLTATANPNIIPSTELYGTLMLEKAGALSRLHAYVTATDRQMIKQATEQAGIAPGKTGDWLILQVLQALETRTKPQPFVTQRSIPMSSNGTTLPHPSVVLAVGHWKGGVGKTTSAVYVATLLEQALRQLLGSPPMGQTWVVLLDFDPQGSSSGWAGLEGAQVPVTMADRIRHYIQTPGTAEDRILNYDQGICYSTNLEVDVIPSSVDLPGAEQLLSTARQPGMVLRKLLAPLRKRYQVIVIDNTSSLGRLTENALTAADELIIPVEPQFLAVKAMGSLMNLIGEVIGHAEDDDPGPNPDLAVAGVIVTKYDRTTHGREMTQEIADYFDQMPAPIGHVPLLGIVPRTIDLSVAAQFGTLGRGRKASEVQEVYQAIVHQLLIRWGWEPMDSGEAYRRQALRAWQGFARELVGAEAHG